MDGVDGRLSTATDHLVRGLGGLALGTTFRNEGSGQPCVSLNRPDRPHGVPVVAADGSVR